MKDLMKDLNGYKVFLRVEDSLGQGAYRCFAAEVAGIHDEPDETHPGPRCDAGLRDWWLSADDVCDYLFGFASPNHYLNWFLYEDGRQAMQDDGRFYLNLYFIPDTAIVEGQFQAVAHSSYMQDALSLPMNLDRDTYERIIGELCQLPENERALRLNGLLAAYHGL